MYLFRSISMLHIIVAFSIGAIIGYFVGCLYNVMNLKRGEYIWNFVLLGVLGSFGFDLFFSFMVNNNILPNWLYYYRPIIVLEQITGAIIFPIIVYKPFIEFKPPQFKRRAEGSGKKD